MFPPVPSFSGNVTVNAGTVFAGGNGVPIGAGAGIYGFHNGNNSALGTISGAAAAARQIVVNSSGTLSFIGDDTFGDRAAAVTPVPIVANGGMVINGPSVPNNGTPVNTGFQGAFNLLGPVQLNGATMRSTWGKFTPNQDGPNPQGYPGFQAFAFRSSVTSSGLSTIDSQLDRVPRFGGFHLGGAIADPNPTFSVASGTLNLDGTLFFDLAGASTTPGTTWNIVTGRRSTSSTEARLRSRVRPGPSPGMLACGRSWTGPTRGRSSRWEARCR